MKLLRTAAMLTALFLASQASANVTSVSFSGTLQQPGSSLSAYYTDGMSFTGQLTVDDGASPFGTLHIGGNTIAFSGAEAFVQDAGVYTALTVAGGDYWGIGGTVSETWNLGLSGVQIGLSFPAGIPWNTPLSEILALQPGSLNQLALSYGGDDAVYGAITDIAPLVTSPLDDGPVGAPPLTAVPEPGSALLLALGLGVIVAGRRARQR